MNKNVGWIDRSLRFLLGALLIWIGLWELNGLKGNSIGISVAVVSLLPFYMTIAGSCFVFRWFKIHSLSKSEYKKYGDPYPKNKD